MTKEELMKKIEKEEKWLIHALNDHTDTTFSYSVDIAFDAVKRYVKEYIKALEQEPCEDAISREAAVNAIYDLCGENVSLKENPLRDNPHMDAVVDALENLPSVTPQQKVGQWIKVIDEIDNLGNETWHHECSICGNGNSGWGKNKYCPDCGTKMESEKPNKWIGAEVLDKIRAEIDQYLFRNEFGSAYREEVSQIIDKYKAESEV